MKYIICKMVEVIPDGVFVFVLFAAFNSWCFSLLLIKFSYQSANI